MKRYATIAAVAAGMAFTTPALGHPLPPGWTTLPCVVLDARTMVLDLSTGAEITPDAQGRYALGTTYVARLVNGQLVDATTGVLLPTAAGAVVDASGTPIAMASLWSQVACPKGFAMGTPGATGPAGPVGIAGPAGPTGPAGAPGAIVAAAPNRQAVELRKRLKRSRAQAKRWKKAWIAARNSRPAAVQPAVAG